MWWWVRCVKGVKLKLKITFYKPKAGDRSSSDDKNIKSILWTSNHLYKEMHRFDSKALERIFLFAAVADSAGFVVFAAIWWRLGGTAFISEMTQFHVFILIVILWILLNLPYLVCFIVLRAAILALCWLRPFQNVFNKVGWCRKRTNWRALHLKPHVRWRIPIYSD